MNKRPLLEVPKQRCIDALSATFRGHRQGAPAYQDMTCAAKAQCTTWRQERVDVLSFVMVSVMWCRAAAVSVTAVLAAPLLLDKCPHTLLRPVVALYDYVGIDSLGSDLFAMTLGRQKAKIPGWSCEHGRESRASSIEDASVINVYMHLLPDDDRIYCTRLIVTTCA